MSILNRVFEGRRRLLITNLGLRFSPSIVDLLSTIIMGLGTTLAAWSGFQAEQWYLRSSNSLLTANIEGRQSERLTLTANQKALLDASMFLQYFEALVSGEKEKANFVRKHMRPEFSEAFRIWMKDRATSGDPLARSPLEASYYRIREREEAAVKSNRSAIAVEKAFAAQKIARTYSFTAVLFTIVLFLGGIASKVPGTGQKTFVAWLSAAVIAIALMRVIQLPLAP